MANVDTEVTQIIVNRLTKTQLENAGTLPADELYCVDPEFTGDKILTTSSDGSEIIETSLSVDNLVTDVQVNGTTITSSGVANIGKASNDGTITGVVQLSNTYGSQTVNGYLAAVDRSYAGFVSAQSTSIASVGGVKAYVGGMSVAYNASQSLTDAQKEQARTNIGAGTGNTTAVFVDWSE